MPPNLPKKVSPKSSGVRDALLVNSGSSANPGCALSCLTSPKLGDRQLVPGDEVITAAAGFPTTVNPILQNNLVPVFIDVEIPTYNVDVRQLEEALSPRTRAIMIAHTLGNPFNVEAVAAFAKTQPCGLLRIVVTQSAPLLKAEASEPLAISPPQVSILPITSPWAKAAAY